MKVKPLHDRILIKRVEEKETVKGGIIIPDTAKEKPQEGEVIAVGHPFARQVCRRDLRSSYQLSAVSFQLPRTWTGGRNRKAESRAAVSFRSRSRGRGISPCFGRTESERDSSP